ncbi:YiaA/YiaB family inner membrane protein [Archangium gephyra]|uniref:YiaA/YiaB family inner membrane protein n=1 Tax=Archangium gephyra TaxID=48 RepID=UPI0035D4E2CB
MSRPNTAAVQPTHSGAWVIQTWLSFALAVGVMAIGIYHLPIDGWQKAFLGMGLLFTIGSTFSLSKTVRDQHEQERLTARIDEARVTKLLAEVDPVGSLK